MPHAGGRGGSVGGNPGSRGAGGHGWLVLACALLLALAAIEARAAITWSSASRVEAGATPPPVHFEAGAGASNARYVKDFALSANKTGFSGEIKAKPGADSTVKDLVRLTNAGAAERTVTLRADPVSNARFEVLTWTVRDGATVKAVVDHRHASPSATVALPAGASWPMDLRIDLADGAGRDNAVLQVALTLEVT